MAIFSFKLCLMARVLHKGAGLPPRLQFTNLSMIAQPPPTHRCTTQIRCVGVPKLILVNGVLKFACSQSWLGINGQKKNPRVLESLGFACWSA
jgi:hypothetical protein